LLTGGLATCVSSVNDYFTKFNYSWNYYHKSYKNLETWLDPLNSGVYETDGLDYNASVYHLETENLTVYPTPGTGDYKIQLDRISAKNGTYSIYTTTGEIIQHGIIQPDNLFSFNIHVSPAGIYFIRLVFPDRVLTARIIHIPL
jgi:hypothetical protein